MIIAQKTKNISSLFLLLGLVGAGCGETKTLGDAEISDNPETGNENSLDSGDVDDSTDDNTKDVNNPPSDVTQKPDVISPPAAGKPFIQGLATSESTDTVFKIVYDVEKNDLQVTPETTVKAVPKGNLFFKENRLFFTSGNNKYGSFPVGGGEASGLVGDLTKSPRTSHVFSSGINLTTLRGMVGPYAYSTGYKDSVALNVSGDGLSLVPAYTTKTTFNVGNINDIAIGTKAGQAEYITFVGDNGIQSCKTGTSPTDCVHTDKATYFTKIVPAASNSDFLVSKCYLNVTRLNLIVVQMDSPPTKMVSIQPNLVPSFAINGKDYSTGLLKVDENMVLAYGPSGLVPVDITRKVNVAATLKVGSEISTQPVTQVRLVPAKAKASDTNTTNFVVALEGKVVVVYAVDSKTKALKEFKRSAAVTDALHDLYAVTTAKK